MTGELENLLVLGKAQRSLMPAEGPLMLRGERSVSGPDDKET